MTELRSIILLSITALTSLLAVVALTVCTQAEAATFRWETPTERENGEPLAVSEIACYEIVGRSPSGTLTWRAQIPGGRTQVYHTNDPIVTSITDFRIAVCDTDGLFSEYVVIKPARLAPPTGGGLKAPSGGGIR